MTQGQINKLMAESPQGWNLLDQAVTEGKLDLKSMTSREAFELILEYEGIIGYAQVIVGTVNALEL